MSTPETKKQDSVKPSTVKNPENGSSASKSVEPEIRYARDEQIERAFQDLVERYSDTMKRLAE